MEALQMVKFTIKHDSVFDFTSHRLTPEAELGRIDEPDSHDLLHKLATGGEEVMDQIVNLLGEED